MDSNRETCFSYKFRCFFKRGSNSGNMDEVAGIVRMTFEIVFHHLFDARIVHGFDAFSHLLVAGCNVGCSSKPLAHRAVWLDGREAFLAVTLFAVDEDGGVFGQGAQDVRFDFVLFLLRVAARGFTNSITPGFFDD
jgi:hypothetical protein